ncbi:MAG: hypothetical protein O2985_02455 [Proteobacteria bacterium]|nr:hypothetical protein [Pseudomonadota bacterium]
MVDTAVNILAKAMYDVVDGDDSRKKDLGKTMRSDFNELDLRPHFNDLSPSEKSACSDRAENLAETHSQHGTVIKDAPVATGMNWSDSLSKSRS